MLTYQDTERNIFTNTITTGGIFTAGILEDITHFYGPLIPLFIIAIVLIATDARFGVMLSKKNGLKVRFSRLVRRSVNKFLDYFCWVTIAGLFGFVYGDSFDLPNFELIAMVGIYGLELNSIVNNYLEVKGINLRLNFIKWFTKKTDTTDLIEKYDLDKYHNRSNKNSSKSNKK